VSSTKVLVTILTFLLVAGLNLELPAEETSRYAVAVLPTPVFNTPDFPAVFGGEDGSTLQLNEKGQIKELELICFPETVFRIEETIEKNGIIVYRVITNDYPHSTNQGLFVDSRFVKIADVPPSERPKKLPSKSTIIQKLLSAGSSNYLWGGNYKGGIPQMLSFYKPASSLPSDVENKWRLKGLDCSGLLYYATNGYTPRNTSVLVNYGKPIQIAGLKFEEIIQKLESLDIIVWVGHVTVILDKENAIVGCLDCGRGLEKGFRIRQTKEVLAEIMGRRIPVDSYNQRVEGKREKFVIRRWY